MIKVSIVYPSRGNCLLCLREHNLTPDIFTMVGYFRDEERISDEEAGKLMNAGSFEIETHDDMFLVCDKHLKDI